MLVAVSLDHPIRKGQTSYNHIICQFPSEEETSLMLDISEEALAAKNEKCGGHLKAEMKGNAHEMFTKCLKGLSGAKVHACSCYLLMSNSTNTSGQVECDFHPFLPILNHIPSIGCEERPIIELNN